MVIDILFLMLYNINMKKALAIYKSQTHQANKRGIEMKMSFEEWYDWWLNNGIDKNGPSQKQMGVSRSDTLCMCRFNDTGPYALDNIYCATSSQNSSDMESYGSMFHIKRRIKTPQGIFNSMSDWARYCGCAASTFYTRRNKFPDEYYYLDDRKNKPHLND